MLNRSTVLVPLFVAVQTGLIYWIASGERLPPKPDLPRFPVVVGEWERAREDPIDPDIVAQLGADGLLNWTYVRHESAAIGNLFVAWFQSQRGGASQPHSPQVCLPGAGWTFDKREIAALDTDQGAISINQDIVSQGQQRAAVLYWYQTPKHVIASEWEAKFWVVADALKDKRTDTSLVRVVVWNGNRSDDVTTAAAREFARKAYPMLREILPR